MASADSKREVLAHDRALKANIADALNDVEAGAFPELKAKLLAIQRAASGVNKYLSNTIETVHYNEHRQMDSVAAEKVFAIPELLEGILENLEVVDIIRCDGVCRTMRDTISASNKLQVKLCLVPTSEDNAIVWPVWVPHYADFDFKGQPRAEFAATIGSRTGSSTALPTVGSRWKRTLVRQPPIRSMLAYIECCDFGLPTPVYVPGDPSTQPIIGFKSDIGITIGDLLKAAERFFEAHRECPLDNQGINQRLVHFEGPLESFPDEIAYGSGN